LLVLSDADVAKTLTMKDTLAALELAFSASARGETVSSPWVQLFVESDGPKPDNIKLDGCQMRTASGYAPSTNVVAVRLSADKLRIGNIDGSIRRDTVPAARGKWVGLVMLFSVQTGEPLALFPDAHLQAFRVGATNGLGAKYLSRPDTSRVGMLGAGWQAEARLRAYSEVFKLEQVKVYSPRLERRNGFVTRMTEVLGVPVIAVPTANDAVGDADIIAAATSSITPVIEERWIRPGVHIDCLRELEFDRGVIDRSDIAAYNWRDPIAGVMTYRKERFIAASSGTEGGYPEVDDRGGWWNDETVWRQMITLEDMIAKAHPGRADDEQVTLFLSRGVGHQFSAVGAVILERALKMGLGLTVPPDLILQDHPT
jgi:ornithine cyclodeaminase/alanine dehydrogenase-like protein (mu-crystallin family)